MKNRKRSINCWVKLQNIHHNPSKMSPVIFLIPRGYLNFSIFSQPSKQNRLKGKMSGKKKVITHVLITRNRWNEECLLSQPGKFPLTFDSEMLESPEYKDIPNQGYLLFFLSFKYNLQKAPLVSLHCHRIEAC